MRNFILFLACILSLYKLQAQNNWNENADLFVIDTQGEYFNYNVSEIKSALTKATKLIDSFCDTCSTKSLSTVYLLRAAMHNFQLNLETSAYSDTYIPPPETLAQIESDFQKALSFCADCKCHILENMLDFYSEYRTVPQWDSLKKEARAVGMPLDNTYLGIDLSYNPQKNISSVELGVLGAWTVFQPKKWVDAKGKKYRKCDYFYPLAVGLFFVGYETSLTERTYQAIKFNPFWIKFMFSAHPLQILYAKWNDKKSFIYRPEIGLSFSSFAIDYAYNLPFNKSFDFLSHHNLTVRICIPTFKIDKN